MSHIWTFSPSSEPLLQKCIEAALLQENDNKWIQKFGRKYVNTSNENTLPETMTPAEVIEISSSPENHENKNIQINYDDFFDNIENEIRLDIIAKECSNNSYLLTLMAEKLSANAVEKLFNSIFASKDIEQCFLESMLYIFLPNYIKKQYSWLCIDLLVKINDSYTELCQKLFQILLQDTEIPNNVLNSYVNVLNEEKQSIFMKNVTDTEFSSKSFAHNTLLLYTVYKDCKKTDKIQNYINKNLVKHSKYCSSDRNFGRLFLAYLQAEKSLEKCINIEQLEECLHLHTSPFKRPCILLLKQFVND